MFESSAARASSGLGALGDLVDDDQDDGCAYLGARAESNDSSSEGSVDEELCVAQARSRAYLRRRNSCGEAPPTVSGSASAPIEVDEDNEELDYVEDEASTEDLNNSPRETSVAARSSVEVPEAAVGRTHPSGAGEQIPMAGTDAVAFRSFGPLGSSLGFDSSVQSPQRKLSLGEPS